ncbi:MAG: FMN-dependent NADH-azoreductase [Paracoccaceae bacterium]
MTNSILRIDASARQTGSVSRDLTDRIVARLGGENVVTRDLAMPLPQVDETWVGANFTPKENRTEDQKNGLKLSDELIAELRAADTIVIGLPIYNFAAPAAFKAWIDQIVRAGETFRYTETGPVGLVTGKKAIVVLASGGVALDSDWDYTSGYVRHVLGFIGITDVTFIDASGSGQNQDVVPTAQRAVEALELAA